MDFLQTIDFTFVGLVIVIIYELIGKSFDTYYLSITRKCYTCSVPTSSCLYGLFYLFFIVYLLWNPVLWFPALLVILIGTVTGTTISPVTNKIKEHFRKGGKSEDHMLKGYRNRIQTYYFIDKILTLLLFAWMFILHLTVLGIIA